MKKSYQKIHQFWSVNKQSFAIFTKNLKTFHRDLTLKYYVTGYLI